MPDLIEGPGPGTNTVKLTLAGEKAAILELKGQGEAVQWQMGVHYNNIVKHALYTQGHYKNAPEFFRKELRQVARSNLVLYGAVARTYTREQAAQHGVSKLGLLLTYQNSRPAQPHSPEPSSVTVEWTDAEGRAIKRPFPDCSTRDLRQAIGHQLGKRKPAPAPPAAPTDWKGYQPEGDWALLDDAQAKFAMDIQVAIGSLGLDGAGIGVIPFVTEDGADFWVDLRGVRPDVFDALMDLLGSLNLR